MMCHLVGRVSFLLDDIDLSKYGLPSMASKLLLGPLRKRKTKDMSAHT